MVSVITPERCGSSPILVTESGGIGNFCQLRRPESCHFLTVTSGGGTNWGSGGLRGFTPLLHGLEDFYLVLWILGWISQNMKSEPACHTHQYKDNDWRLHSVVERQPSHRPPPKALLSVTTITDAGRV